MLTEKTFGSREAGADYTECTEVYLIAIERGDVFAVRSESGAWVLPGGAVTATGSHEDDIRHACLALTGYDVTVEDYVTSADGYLATPSLGYLHTTQIYYSGAFTECVAPPSPEAKRELCRLPLDAIRELASPMHRYAVEACVEMLRSDAHGSDDEDL